MVNIPLIASWDIWDYEQRLWLYKRSGLIATKKTFIKPGCRFEYPDLSNIKMGYNTFMNYGCYIDNHEAITIEDEVHLAPMVSLLTTTHNIGDAHRRVGRGCVRSPIHIGKGCWIGAHAIIFPGVVIEEGCVIGAGAIVNRNCKANGLYVGVPARLIRILP